MGDAAGPQAMPPQVMPPQVMPPQTMKVDNLQAGKANAISKFNTATRYLYLVIGASVFIAVTSLYAMTKSYVDMTWGNVTTLAVCIAAIVDLYIVINHEIIIDKINMFNPTPSAVVIDSAVDLDGRRMFEMDTDVNVMSTIGLASLIFGFLSALWSLESSATARYYTVFLVGFISSISLQATFIYTTTRLNDIIKSRQDNNMFSILV